MSLRLTRVSLEHIIFYKSDLELCCLHSDAVTADLEPGLRYSIHKQVTSSAGWITISNQHKWKGQKWVIHQPDNVDQNQNNRKAMELYSHNDHDIPLKTTNCVHLVSSWNAFPEMNFSNKKLQTPNMHVQNITALQMLKLISNIYQQGPNMLELWLGFISLLLERQHVCTDHCFPTQAAQLGVP